MINDYPIYYSLVPNKINISMTALKKYGTGNFSLSIFSLNLYNVFNISNNSKFISVYHNLKS